MTTFLKSIVFLLLFTLPGLAVPVVLGPLQTPANFNRTAFGPSFIDYANPQQSAPEAFHPATQTYEVRLPTGYDPAKSYGLICFIDWVNPGGTPPAAWQPVLDQYDLIWMAATNVGNSAWTATRRGATIMGAFRMTELYRIDPTRIYAVGTSGGAQVASDMLLMRKDFFKGFIGLAGVSFNGDWLTANGTIPSWNPPGRMDDANTDNDSGIDYGWSDISSVVGGGLNPTYSLLPNHPHAIITNYTDFRRTEIIGIYRYFFMNHGNPVKLIVRPGGHATYEGSSFEEAVRFMTAPNLVILRDRFENANLGLNEDAANTLEAGAGFLDRSMPGATAIETQYTYNSKTQNVLRLTPGTGSNAAMVEAKNRFNWTNPDGITIDAKLRAETAAGTNQQVGLHVARGDSDDTPENNPGFHMYYHYATGVKNRAVLVTADGTTIELAKWDHVGTTHPMNAAASDKMFWNATLAPEYVGKTKDFRGEDVRVLLNQHGFQLTFIRPAANLETNFPGKVVLACKEALLTGGPNVGTMDGEDHAVVLQARWSDLNLASAVNALSFRHWKLLISNRSLDGINTAGNALVDEITLRANAEETHFMPPSIITSGDLTVNASTAQGAIVHFTPTASDASGSPLSVTCNPPSGQGFPIGSTPVTCMATDAYGNVSTATFSVIVQANGFTPAPPDAPQPPVISPGLTAATLVWQPSNYTTSYSVKRASSAVGPFTPVAIGLTSTTFTDTGLVYNVPTYYVITAGNYAGESLPSQVASVTTIPGTAVKADNASDLNTLASWTTNQLPGNGDTALWDSNVTTSNTVSVGNGTNLRGLRLTNPGGNVTITSEGAALTLGSSGIDLTESVRSLTLTAPIILAANQSWTSGSFGSIGDIQLRADAVISGSGKLSFSQAAGRSLSLSQANTFSGGFTLGAGASVSVGTSAAVASGNTTSSAFGAYTGSQTLTIEGGGIDHAGYGFHAKNVRVTGDFKFINNARINFGGAFDMAGGTRTMTLVRSVTNASTLAGGGNATLNVSSGGAFVVSNGTFKVVADATVPAGNFVMLTPQAGTAFTNNAGFILGDKIYYGKGSTGTLNGATTVPSVTLEAGAVWDLSDGTNARNPQVNSLAGAGTVLNTWNSGGTGALHTLVIKGNTNSGRTDFSGKIFDHGGTIFTTRTLGQTSVTKEGTTTQVFSGSNTYTGTTSINGGSLVVNGSISSPANLTVATNATIGGSGTIASPTTVNGTLAPGDGPGTLTLTGSLAMSATSKLQWQLPTNAITGGDFLNAAAVTLTSGAKLDLLFNSPGSLVSFSDPFWQSNRSWPVITSTALTGNFTLGSVSADSVARTTTGYGSFSLSHAGNAVTLQWTAYSSVERWRFQYFSTISNTGDAADAADPDADGLSNAEEFSGETNPLVADLGNVTVSITSPVADPITLVTTSLFLHLSSSVVATGTGATSMAWSKFSGPGAVTFSQPTALTTTALFSSPGTFVLRLTATKGTVMAFAERTVIVEPPADFTFREGIHGFSHTATFIRNDGSNQTWNSGARDQLLVGYNSNGALRSLFSFDLATLPPAFQVRYASLDLWTSNIAGSGTVGDLSLQPLLATPTEGSGNSDSNKAIGADTGATWGRRTNAMENLNWTSPGGDFSASVLASIPGFIATVTDQTRKSFSTSPAFVASLEAARQSASPLNLLVQSSTASGVHFTRFHSDDSSDAAKRPLLTLGFSANAAPSIQTGPPPAATTGVANPLVGSATGATNTTWSLVSGPGTATFAEISKPANSVTFSLPGDYLLRLTANNSNGEISSTLAVNVANPLNPAVFADWQSIHWPGISDPNLIADAADADHDGLNNLLEWALHLDPKSADVFNPTILKSASSLEFTYTRRKTPGATFQVEWSDSLGNDWSMSGVTVASPIAIDATSEQITATLPIENGDRRFVRLRISTP